MRKTKRERERESEREKVGSGREGERERERRKTNGAKYVYTSSKYAATGKNSIKKDTNKTLTITPSSNPKVIIFVPEAINKAGRERERETARRGSEKSERQRWEKERKRERERERTVTLLEFSPKSI